MGSCSAGGSSGERLCILADHKVIPKYRIEAMKYQAQTGTGFLSVLSKMLILYKVLYWLLHLRMGQPFERRVEAAVQPRKEVLIL